MNYYFKVFVATVLAVLITGVIFFGLIKLIKDVTGLDKEDLKSASQKFKDKQRQWYKELDNGSKQLHKEFKDKYKTVTIIKDDGYLAVGVKTYRIKSDYISDKFQNNYFVLETTSPLMAVFKYGEKDVFSQWVEFEIPTGRHIYLTKETGFLGVKRVSNSSEELVIVGTDVKRFKIEKYKGYREDKDLDYRQDFSRSKGNIGKWVETEWYYANLYLNMVRERGADEPSSPINASFSTDDIYAIGIYTKPGAYIYFRIKEYEGNFRKFENGSESMLIEPLFKDDKERGRYNMPIRKCYRFPPGLLFLKCVYRGKRLTKRDEVVAYIDIYGRNDPFDKNLEHK